MTHFIPDPADPSEVVADDPEVELCDRCEEAPAEVFYDDKGYCNHCLGIMDLQFEAAYEAAKDRGKIEEEE